MPDERIFAGDGVEHPSQALFLRTFAEPTAVDGRHQKHPDQGQEKEGKAREKLQHIGFEEVQQRFESNRRQAHCQADEHAQDQHKTAWAQALANPNQQL